MYLHIIAFMIAVIAGLHGLVVSYDFYRIATFGTDVADFARFMGDVSLVASTTQVRTSVILVLCGVVIAFVGGLMALLRKSQAWLLLQVSALLALLSYSTGWRAIGQLFTLAGGSHETYPLIWMVAWLIASVCTGIDTDDIARDDAKSASAFSNFVDSDFFKGLLPFIGLVVILGAMYYLTDGRIMQPKRLRLLLSQVYYPMIVATGVFFVMTLGSIDFTEGSTLGVASIVVSVLSFYSIPLAIIGGILTGAAIGAVNGFFHVKFRLQSFIVTICTMYLFRGVCAYFTTETAIPASAAIKALDSDNLKIGITIAVLVVAWFLFRFTRIGNDVKAVGSGETAAKFSGVRTDKVKFLAFVAAGALTGLAAFVNVIKVGSITSTAGNQLETQILISLVLGGLPITGGAKVRFSNIVVGTLMYTVLNNGLVMLGFESATQQLIKGIVFLIFVALTIDRKALKVIK